MDRKLLLAALIIFLLLAIVPYAYAGTCGIYIYDLDAHAKGLITFKINNTGDADADITYTVRVGLKEVSRVENLSLDAGEWAEGVGGYSFLYGNYKIMVEAVSDCGSRDSEEMVYALLETLPEVCFNPEGLQGDLRCDVYSGFVLECRDGSWIYHGEDEGCRSECYPYCTGEKLYPLCRADIESVDFLDRIVDGSALKLEAGIRNTGRAGETINLKLYINGRLQRDYLLKGLAPDEMRTEVLYYYPRAGENRFRLEAIANCSASDSMEGSFLVIERPPEPKPKPEPEPQPLVTSVSISPRSLDIPLCKSKTLELDIESSRSQEFTILVTGVEGEWLQYPGRAEITGRDRVYVYITPQELGTYNITVSIQGEEEAFREDVGFYVVPEQPSEEKPEDWLSGASRFLAMNWLSILLVIGIIVFILVIFLGAKYWQERGRI